MNKDLVLKLIKQHARIYIGACSKAQALVLLTYDHHTVIVGGEPAVLLSASLLDGDETFSDPFELLVIFNHAGKHPPAPQLVQQIIDQVNFQPLIIKKDD
jgi:hypothetical protein